MDKINRTFAVKKRYVIFNDVTCSEIEHLLTMSLFYQVLIGFLPLPLMIPMIPMDRVHDLTQDKR